MSGSDLERLSLDLLYQDLIRGRQLERRKPGQPRRASFPDLVKTMVEADLQQAQRDQLCQTHGFAVHRPEE